MKLNPKAIVTIERTFLLSNIHKGNIVYMKLNTNTITYNILTLIYI